MECPSKRYIRLYKSFIRFCNMSRGESEILTNSLAGCLGEQLPDTLSDGMPYNTEVQFFKVMSDLYDRIDQSRLSVNELEAVLKLRCNMNDVSDRFWRCFGVEIDGPETIYSICQSNSPPSEDPLICLIPQRNGI